MPKITPQTNKKTSTKTTKKRSSAVSSAVERIIDLADLETDFIKIAIFGLCGTGKTRLAASFNHLGKVLYCVCSSNGVNECRSIKGMKDIKVVEIVKANDIVDLVEEAISGEYKTIVIDHVTGFGDLVLAEILGIEKVPEQNSWGMASQQQYQQMGSKVKTYLREVIAAPLNVVLVGQERQYRKSDDADGDTETSIDDIILPYISIASTPTVASWVWSAVDYFGQTFKRKEVKIVSKKVGTKIKKRTVIGPGFEYCFRVGPHDVYMTKFRVPPGTELPNTIVNPTCKDLLTFIEGEE